MASDGRWRLLGLSLSTILFMGRGRGDACWRDGLEGESGALRRALTAAASVNDRDARERASMVTWLTATMVNGYVRLDEGGRL